MARRAVIPHGLTLEQAFLSNSNRPPGPASLWFSIGSVLRTAGRCIDAFGLNMQGDMGTVNKIVTPTTLINHGGQAPTFEGAHFVAPSANLIGSVELRKGSSVWYASTLRGDAGSITVGDNSNVQDRTVVSANSNAVSIGRYVSLGAGSVVDSATIGDESSVGIGSTILAGAEVSKNSMLAAGSVLAAGVKVPSGQLWAGNPAKFVCDLTAEDIDGMIKSAELTSAMSAMHHEECWKDLQQIEQDHKDYKTENERDPEYAYTLRDYHDGIFEPLPTLSEQLARIGAPSHTYFLK